LSQARIRNLVVVLVTLIVLVVLFVLLRPESSAPESSNVRDTQEQPVALAINGNTMSPYEVSVTEGDQVNLQITSDHPVKLHLHGYDLEEEVGPEEPGELSFKATITGQFPIEDHDTEAELGTLLVQPR
jgi:FtsP/CotA-like multicopper oxidase with cupredoxin domain